MYVRTSHGVVGRRLAGVSPGGSSLCCKTSTRCTGGTARGHRCSGPSSSVRGTAGELGMALVNPSIDGNGDAIFRSSGVAAPARGVAQPHFHPHESNDNPFKEAQFKTP